MKIAAATALAAVIATSTSSYGKKPPPLRQCDWQFFGRCVIKCCRDLMKSVADNSNISLNSGVFKVLKTLLQLDNILTSQA
ncbi:hypothetical protein [Paracoccus aerodenitrificans]|uniref:hypothetical protein n=1 Tax=Paracoccus aerodenitrificans TaxID=3017781 RepID=UPI0022F0B99A|nr:hypothetical protein [Paracoccus aerodenitrificans]WBU63608.1 hypothetical protein PAE61_14830 [Paracoccus aerodenitrificans]